MGGEGGGGYFFASGPDHALEMFALILVSIPAVLQDRGGKYVTKGLETAYFLLLWGYVEIVERDMEKMHYLNSSLQQWVSLNRMMVILMSSVNSEGLSR